MGATVGDDLSEGVQSANGEACKPGETLSGRYRIVRFIARGATGAVYEADDLVVGTSIAIKVLHPERACSSTAIERLHRELALARRITHRNVCRLHDVGEDSGRVFLTMELLDGETLAARIARGPIGGEELDEIATQLVAALSAAHNEGVVHRDFKPQNVILVEDRVVVTDFGLARSTFDEDDAISLTGDTAMIGTPAYMAPEQVEGRDATIASDVYALGIVLFELASGQPPFREATALATATARLHRTPARIIRDDLDPRWRATIARCLERDPAARFSTAQAVLDARHGRAKRRPRVVAITLVCAIVAAGAIGFAFLQPRNDAGVTIAPIDFFPSSVRPESTKAKVMFDRANAALAVGDREQARRHLEVAVANSPDDPIAQAGLSEVLGTLGYRERSEEASRRAMRFHEQLDEEPRAYVKAIDAASRDDATEVAALEKLVAIAPHPAYRVRLANIFVKQAKPDLAERALDGMRMPPIAAALFDATIAEARSEPTAALAHAIRAMTLAPSTTRPNQHAMALLHAAAAHWRLEDLASATRDYLRAIELGDTGVQLRAREGLMDLEGTSDDLVAGANRYKEQAALLRTLGDREYLASTLMDGASLFAEIGYFGDAEAMMAEARTHATAISSAVEVARVDALEARMASWRGQLERARTLAERAYHAGHAVERPGIQGNSFYTWTIVLLEYDDPSALANMRALRTETTERLVDCVAAFREGDLDRAERIGHALATFETYEGRIAHMLIAQVAIIRGRLDEAEAALAKVEARLDGERRSLVVRERLEHSWAMLGTKRGNVAAALARFDAYIESCASVGLALAAVRSGGAAAVLAIEGRSPDAKQRAAAAIARAEELGMKRTAREVREALAR
ncbi:MAG: protein kinase domain-containing protein [Kofleriaceae bacterium]